MKCDLHVHTLHSGMCTIPGFRTLCRECYTDPAELYETLKRGGMDLVTVTDHDSIGAAEALRHHEDFFLSEEVTVQMPSGTLLHVGVYDIDEREHMEIQKRRDDLPALLAYLSERRLLFSVNHMFSSVTGRRDLSDFTLFAEFFPAFETRNGHMLEHANECAELFAGAYGKAVIGGSDAHVAMSAATAWTEVRGARTKEEFLAAVTRGDASVHGASGHFGKLTRDVFEIATCGVLEHKWLLPLAPLVAAAIPAYTLTNYICEWMFLRAWTRALEEAPPRRADWRAHAFPEVAV